MQSRTPPPDPAGFDPTREYRACLRLDAVVGRSAALARAFRRIRAVAGVGSLPVLLTGESGTGKSLFARVLHENSPRSGNAWVEVNCAAIPVELWEAEFFGSTKHAYTQATARGGRFAAAEGGTLFLDEIGEIPLEHQAKLLRVLDQGCYERLGEDRTRQADVRIVAATNRDLEAAVQEGRFRQDLFFRLDRFRIHVPALRERPEDIRELAQVLAERESKALGLPRVDIDEEVLSRLADADWPGNVRQLQSAIGQALIEVCADGARTIRSHHVRALSPSADAPALPSESVRGRSRKLRHAMRDFKRQFVTSVLRDEGGNITRTARCLGLSRSHLYALIHELDIELRRD